jgi:DNA-binding CsgD family transcriptional regulator
MPSVTGGMLERAAELDRIAACRARATMSRGSVVAIEGPPGIGKTTLLEAATAAADDAGVRVLTARPGPLEQDAAFSVAREVFAPLLRDPAARAKLRRGEARLAAPILGGTRRAFSGPDAAAAARLGLFAAVAALSAEAPLLVAVDDLQYADEPSLAWLVYLAGRVSRMRVMVLVGVRAGSALRREGVALLLNNGGVERVRLEPLSARAVAALARRELGGDVGDGVAEACHRATGGNPWLMLAVLHALRAQGAREVAADDVAGLVAESLGDALTARLRLKAGADVRVAEAAAVLGSSARLATVAATAGLDAGVAALAADRLAADGIFSMRCDVTFAHPLVADAIYRGIGLQWRGWLHARAAVVLLTQGFPAPTVAAHALAAPPGGRPQLATALMRAAEDVGAAAPELALRYLQRALDEPPAEADRAEIELRLGLLGAATGDDMALQHLQAVRRSANAAPMRAAAGEAHGLALLWRGRHVEGLAALDDASAELPADSEQRLAIEALALAAASTALQPQSVEQRLHEGRRRAGSGATAGQRLMASVVAFCDAVRGGDATHAAALARRALAVPADPEHVARELARAALLSLDLIPEAERELTEMLRRARAAGRLADATLALAWRAEARLRAGRLAVAEADARSALALTAEQAGSPARAMSIGALAVVLLERGALQEAAALAQDIATAGAASHTLLLGPALARARVQAGAGALVAAADELTAIGEAAARWRERSPSVLPWRGQLALALARTGNPARGRELAHVEADLAAQQNTPAALGRALHAVALVDAPDRRVQTLRRAVELLEPTPARLDTARAMIDLGAALRRANRRVESRDPLRRGIDLAQRCGAHALVSHGTLELRATGARPRRTLIAGRDSLTPTQRRVAALAGSGMTTREMARVLFVTQKTIETHLRAIYGKLGVHDRRSLKAALEAPDDGSAAGLGAGRPGRATVGGQP